MKKFYIVLISLFLFACNNPTTVDQTEYVKDTILVNKNDTISIIKNDTTIKFDTITKYVQTNPNIIIKRDTVVSIQKDTIIKLDTIINNNVIVSIQKDTIIKVDTLIKVNTIKTTIHDTLIQVNSIMVHDTLIDTLITTKTDTLTAYKRNLFIIDLLQWEQGSGLIGNHENQNLLANMLINYTKVYSFGTLLKGTGGQMWADGIRYAYAPNKMMELDNGTEQQIWTYLKINNVIDSVCLLRNGVIYASGKYKSATEFHLRFEKYNPTYYMRFTVGTNGYLTYLSDNAGG